MRSPTADIAAFGILIVSLILLTLGGMWLRRTEIADISDEGILERAVQVCNGERFKRLWAGNVSEYGDDHSRADLGLCNILAFWTGGDAERIARLFRLSSFMRDV